MKNKKPTVFILGKLPPPYFGPSIAKEIILNSTMLNEKYRLIHIDTRLNVKLSDLGQISIAKIFKVISIYFRFLRQLLKYRPEIILVPVGQETIAFIKDAFFIFFGWLLRSKVLIHLRGSNWLNWQRDSSFIIRGFTRYMLLFCSGVIVLGESLRYLFEPYFNKKKIFVVPNGGNYIFPERQNKTEETRILFLSNLYPSKGIVDVLNASKILKSRNVPFLMDWMGAWSGPDLEEFCKNEINKYQLPITIHSPSTGTKKLQFFSDSDIFVFPPNKPEGHPWVIIEALAAGLPIISTNQGAITDSVIDHVNGFIVLPDNPEQVSEKLETLIKNQALRKEFGKKSRELYENGFTEERMITKLANVFDTVLGSKISNNVSGNTHEERAINYFNDGAVDFSKNYIIKPQFHERIKIFKENILQYLPVNSRMLDLGCGPGPICNSIIRKGYQVTGIDSSQEMIKICNWWLHDFPASTGSKFYAAVIPDEFENLESESFDGVICSSVLEYISKPDLTVEGIARTLKKNGFVFISTPNKNSFFRKIELIINNLTGYPKYFNHVHDLYDLESLNMRMLSYGLQYVKHQFFSQKSYLRWLKSFLNEKNYYNMILGVYQKIG